MLSLKIRRLSKILRKGEVMFQSLSRFVNGKSVLLTAVSMVLALTALPAGAQEDDEPLEEIIGYRFADQGRARLPTRWRFRSSRAEDIEALGIDSGDELLESHGRSRARTSSTSRRTSAAASTPRAATSVRTTCATSAPATRWCCSTAGAWSTRRATRPRRSAAASCR